MGKITKLDQEVKNPKPSSVLHFFFDSSPPIFILSPSPRSFSLSIGRSSYFFCSTSDFHLLTEVVLSLDPLRREKFSSPVLFRFSSFSRSRSFSGSSSTVRPAIFLLRFPSDFPLSPEVVLSLDPLQQFDLKYFFSGSLQVQNSESL
ncbi:hypothetical protein SLEP1_g48698 [Rubroshorea leprosula]|uniref:Uncharacterized protein n=1 Tax=Rubroshorea leprosula TaxID=152421 RepID=A0AAV5LWS6_9ROSI|nr:hypothetical protein SLEP1_g48698 [Rubroshorea leprosula]